MRKLVKRSVARTRALAIGCGEAGEPERYLGDGIGRSGGGNLVSKDLTVLKKVGRGCEVTKAEIMETPVGIGERSSLVWWWW